MHRFFWTILLVLCIAPLALGEAAKLPDFNLSEDAVAKRVASITPLEGLTPAQWRVIWTTGPATAATVSWSTAEPGKAHSVYYDTVSRHGAPLRYALRQVARENGPYTLSDKDKKDGVPQAYYHHARLKRLEPATTYYFVIKSGDAVSKELRFTTAPADDASFTLFYGGDSRTHQEARIRINCIIGEVFEACPEIIGFTHGGDYISSGANWAEWSAWLSQNELTATRDGRVLPIIPTRGNHDGGPCYDQVFGTPGAVGKNYFVTPLSATTALVTLDNSNRKAGPDPVQTAWLKRNLAALRPELRWLMLSFHIPVYPAVKDPAIELKVWPPVFEQYNVDLVLESDGHCVKRTVPIRNGKYDPTGVVYIGEGGLGAPQRDPKLDRWYLQPPGFASRGDHVQLLDFAPGGLRMRVLMSDGSIADDATIAPKN